MKKEELLAKLGGLENAGEVAEQILSEVAKEVEEARKDGVSDKELTELQTALEEANAELAKYAKDGEMYIDPEEFERLKSFETETADKERAKQRQKAVNALFENHGVPSAARKILAKVLEGEELKINEQGAIENGEQLISALKSEFGELFVSDNKDRAGLGGGGEPPNNITEDFLKIR